LNDSRPVKRAPNVEFNCEKLGGWVVGSEEVSLIEEPLGCCGCGIIDSSSNDFTSSLWGHWRIQHSSNGLPDTDGSSAA